MKHYLSKSLSINSDVFFKVDKTSNRLVLVSHFGKFQYCVASSSRFRCIFLGTRGYGGRRFWGIGEFWGALFCSSLVWGCGGVGVWGCGVILLSLPCQKTKLKDEDEDEDEDEDGS